MAVENITRSRDPFYFQEKTSNPFMGPGPY